MRAITDCIEAAVFMDSAGRSPWIARISNFEQYRLQPEYQWANPYPEKPADHVFISGLCGVCQRPTQFRIGIDLWHPNIGFLYREGLSCKHCTFNGRMRASLQYQEEYMGLAKSAAIYMTERVTPLYKRVAQNYPNTIGSEYLPGVASGAEHEGVRCEDLCALTFANDSFDAIMTFDVLEHVPVPMDGLKEMHRVLRPGGQLLLTVPFMLNSPKTFVRAELLPDGSLLHHMPEVYHGNPLGPPSLAFSEFGWDLLDKMRAVGFENVAAVLYANAELGYMGPPQPLIVAKKR